MSFRLNAAYASFSAFVSAASDGVGLPIVRSRGPYSSAFPPAGPVRGPEAWLKLEPHRDTACVVAPETRAGSPCHRMPSSLLHLRRAGFFLLHPVVVIAHFQLGSRFFVEQHLGAGMHLEGA